jgi:hypothetical protein
VKWNSLTIAGITVLTIALVAQSLKPSPSYYFGLSACRNLQPIGLFGIGTYWLVLVSPSHLFGNAISILLSGMIIERFLSKALYFAIWIGGAAVGGITYAMIAKDCDIFAGPTMISWAFAGLTVTAITINWTSCSWPVKVYAAAIAVSIVSAIGSISAVTGAELASGIFGLACALMIRKRLIGRQMTFRRASIQPGV